MNSETDSYAFSLAAILLTFAGLFMFADASTDRNRIASAQTQACCAERDPKTGQCIRRERCAVEVAYSPVAYQSPFATRPEKHADTKDPDAKMCKALPDIGRLWINVKTDKVWECVGEPHIPAFRWEERKKDKKAGGAPSLPTMGGWPGRLHGSRPIIANGRKMHIFATKKSWDTWTERRILSLSQPAIGTPCIEIERWASSRREMQPSVEW